MEKGGKGDNQHNINEVIKHEETRLYANLGNGLLLTVQRAFCTAKTALVRFKCLIISDMQ